MQTPNVNPMELIFENNGDISEIWVRTPETLKMVLSLLKRFARHVQFQDGLHVFTNKHYDPATAVTRMTTLVAHVATSLYIILGLL